ncbi:MAG TPA: site-2 protease family protein [Patescibacteria group bacterium]|nr:site-2 protease family protein [Patescibacteria group bacterium]
MPGRSYRIGRIAGIPVGVSPLWLVIVALITWSLGDSYFPEEVHGIGALASYALGLASALLLFASILAHELGHALVARRRGIEVEEIDLWLLGGVSRMRGEAHTPGDELRYAIAGPAVTAAIGACFAAALLLLPSSTPAAISALVEYQVIVNGLLFVFNLMPAFPLDGGRVLRSLLWRRSGDLRRSTETAAGVGRGFGYLLIFLGGLELLGGVPEGLWLALIGFFVVTAAGAQAIGAQVQAAFSGMHARELMSAPVVSVPAHVSAAQAGRDYFLTHRFMSFPVVDEAGRAIGLVSLAQIAALTPDQRELRPMGDLAERDPALIVGEEDDVTDLLQRPAFTRVGRAVVVDALGRPVGLLSITDVERVLRASMLSDRQTGAGTPPAPGAGRAAAVG